MKVDKDQLIKHRFWIMVGLSVPLAAFALLLLVTSVSSSIDKVRKELKAEYNKGAKASGLKTQQEIADKEAAAKVLIKKETTAWNAAYKEQEQLFRWPRDMERRYHISDGFFATEIRLTKLPAEKSAWP